MNICKLCQQEILPKYFLAEYELCSFCAERMLHEIEIYGQQISEWTALANASTDPEEKILYYKLVLDLLYEHKVKYCDNDINLLSDDIDDMIDAVVAGIASARL